MLVTPSGIVIEVNEEHLKNAFLLILVTLSGIIIEVKEEQQENP